MSELTDFRTEKDNFFRDEPNSPLLEPLHRHVPSLSDHDERPDLAPTPAPVVYVRQERVELQTSRGTSKPIDDG